MIQSKFNISVITHPFPNLTGQPILANLIDVLLPLSEHIYVISGDFSYKSKNVHTFRTGTITSEEPFLRWISEQIQAQLKGAYYLIKISKKIDIVFFFLGGRVYLLSVLVAKILGKRIVVAATGSAEGTTKGVYSNRLFGVGKSISKIAGMLESACFSLADQVAVESPSAIHFLELNKYRKKIAINSAMYVDTNIFSVRTGINERRNLIGFVGRLSKEKGVINFVKAVPLILKRHDTIEFLICGDGQLLDNLKEELRKSRCSEKVKFTGWIPHNKLPDYLNELKLLVLPSYSEGLPGIVQEAMACGTPVLATSVGGVPDLIKDNQTGFILEDNSPECIADGVINALSSKNLEELVKNERNLIEEEYAYEAMVRKCREALYTLTNYSIKTGDCDE